MQKIAGTIIGKTVRLVTSFRPNGGHALPGLIVQKIFPAYVNTMLQNLPGGVVMVTGTNGKTTTTKILVQLLEAHGYRVLTNETGSNMVRGIASAVIKNSSFSARLPYEIAIFEVDEASTKQLIEYIKPRWALALNVSRDQLDRFGEVDIIAKHIGRAMEAATEGVITNAGDPLLAKIASNIASKSKVEVQYFGASKNLTNFFPSDYDLAAVDRAEKIHVNPEGLLVELVDFEKQKVTYAFNKAKITVNLKLTGQHNFLNGAAALALAKTLLPQAEPAALVNELAKVTIAFGRGESYKLKNGAVIELVLVKNPASFRQAIASYGGSTANLMIAINDNIADGRDVSWLWDVNLLALKTAKDIITSGTRAADMTLRLNYDEIKTSNIKPNLEEAVVLLSHKQGDKVILSTYTAMLHLYKYLNKTGVRVQ